jgi:hypothetical protein
MNSFEAMAQGRWITEREFARIHGLARRTLTNCRYQDRKAGRHEDGPGVPLYRCFGRAVRYWLEAVNETLPVAA